MAIIFSSEREKREYLDRCIKKMHPNFVSAGRIYRTMIVESANAEAIVVDAGCGDGGIIAEYSGLFKRVIGVDCYSELLEKNNFVDEKIISELDTIALSNDSVDAIFCDFVVEHLEHPQKVFNELYRILKPGGRFIFRTTNVYNPVMFLSKILPFFLHKKVRDVILKKAEETHPTFYRANTWKQLMKLGSVAGFSELKLMRAGNPEYLGFSKITARPAIALERAFDNRFLDFLKMYLIGSFKK